jgi:hypothetical protein
MRKTALLLTFTFCANLAFGQTNGPEDFHVEFTAGLWLVNVSGQAQSGTTAIDLESDLGVEGNKAHFMGKITFKPGHRHRVLFEVVPYRVDGENNLTRTIEYAGTIYSLQDRVISRAELNYLFGGYQYDLVSRGRGHFGIQGGVGYLGATGTITSTTLGTSSSADIDVAFPFAGLEFRGFLLPNANLINLNGEFKAMSIPRYGHSVQAAFHIGVSLARHVTVQAGYALHAIDGHDRDRTERFRPRFAGPVFSVQLRD